MSEKNKLIHLTFGEKCWLMMGICLGIIFTLICLYVYIYLPTITPIQQGVLAGFISGALFVFIGNKFEWGDD